MKNPKVVNYVIISASTSSIILLVNYCLLVWFDKKIPDGMVQLITILITGVFTAVTLRSDKPPI